MGHLRISSFQELGSLSDQGLGQGGGSLGHLRIQTHPVLGSAGGGVHTTGVPGGCPDPHGLRNVLKLEPGQHSRERPGLQPRTLVRSPQEQPTLHSWKGHRLPPIDI